MQDKRAAFEKYKQRKSSILKSDKPIKYISLKRAIRPLLRAALFGSVPQFHNTFDGVTDWINGAIMTNRKVSLSDADYCDKLINELFG